MYGIKAWLKTEIPHWPFEMANLALIPLGIMAGGCYRVWAAARSPFEEFSGVLLVVGVTLLWTVCFGICAPKKGTADV